MTSPNGSSLFGWDTYWLERGPLALGLVPAVGGRIMSLRWNGYELAYTHPDWRGKMLDVSAINDVRTAKRELGFVLWGGDKTWLAPQDRWTDDPPFLDLDSGAYEVQILNPSAIQMRSPMCRETGIQLTRTVSLGAKPGRWSVRHTMTNCSNGTVRWGLWAVSMLQRPATVFLPTASPSSHPNGVKSFAFIAGTEAHRPSVIDRRGRWARVDCTQPGAFKYGVDAPTADLLAFLEGADGTIGHYKSMPVFEGATYGHGCTAEVFNAKAEPYFELELHGPVVNLAPGNEFALTEHCALFDVKPPIQHPENLDRLQAAYRIPSDRETQSEPIDS